MSSPFGKIIPPVLVLISIVISLPLALSKVKLLLILTSLFRFILVPLVPISCNPIIVVTLGCSSVCNLPTKPVLAVIVELLYISLA